jgi:hypothetical protein
LFSLPVGHPLRLSIIFLNDLAPPALGASPILCVNPNITPIVFASPALPSQLSSSLQGSATVYSSA